MTSLGTTSAPHPTLSPLIRLSFPRLLRSEWTKVYTLTSSLLILTLMIGFAIAGAASLAHSALSDSKSALAGGAWTIANIIGPMSLVAEFFVAVLSVLIVSNEYATGQITSTFIAVPRRVPVFAAKLSVAMIIAAAASVICSVAGWAVSSALIARVGLHVPITAPAVLETIGANTAWLVVVAVVSATSAFILRNIALSIAVMFVLLAVLPIVGGHLPAVIDQSLLSSLSSTLVSMIIRTEPVGSLAMGIIVLACWLIVPASLAAALVARRDV